MNARRAAGWLAALSLTLTSCVSGAAAVLPPSPPFVHVSLDEYRFEIAEESIPGGRVVFSMENVGETDHRLSVIPLPDDFPPIREQLRSAEHRFVQQLATIPPLPPGEKAAFAVDLAPGRYALVCLMVADDGELHAQKGMATEFHVP